MLKNIIYILLFFIPFVSFSQKGQHKKISVNEYLDAFKTIAMHEMERSGIPASITLAQGIHESAFGNSELSRKSNNHFGIKCGNNWEGKKYYKWDDDPQKSCFRVYKSANDSYVDHTNFLLNGKRYAFLFEYQKHEYKKWAKGLRKAGYATDPKYPDKLISTIEKYNLIQYDQASGPLTFNTKASPDSKPKPVFTALAKLRSKPRSFLFKSYKPGLFIENSATYAIPFKGESALAVANRFGIQYNRFLKFNDLKEGDRLIDFQPLYIQPKRSSYKGSETYILVKKDITMYEIAQCYGVKLSVLLSKNLILEGQEPKNNEKIYLKEKASVKPELRSGNHIDILPEKYSEPKHVTINSTITQTSNLNNNNIVYRPESQKVEVNNPIYTNDVYTTDINTAKSINVDYLNLNQLSDDDQSSSSVSNNPLSDANSGPGRNYYKNTKRKKIIYDVQSSPFSSDINMNTSKLIVNEHRINDKAIFKKANNSCSSINNDLLKKAPNNDIEAMKTNANIRINNLSENVNPISTSFVHDVIKGETLYGLHRLYLVSVEAIKRVNKLTSNSIAIGDKLLIPTKS